jgi:hypothetical protein
MGFEKNQFLFIPLCPELKEWRNICNTLVAMFAFDFGALTANDSYI